MTDGENELAEKEYKEALSRYNPDDTRRAYLNYGVFLYRA
jgi:Tfp pilus assembly protein PilF